MATEKFTVRRSFAAAADLSASRHLLVAISTTGTINIAGAGLMGFPLEDDPLSGEFGSVSVLGVTKVIAGAAIDAGVVYTSDAAGKAVLTTSTDVSCGITLDAAAAADELITVLIWPGDILV